MHAVGTRGERHVDPVVDDKGDRVWRQRGLDRARRLDHVPRVAPFVAQLHQRRAALGDAARQIGEAAPAGGSASTMALRRRSSGFTMAP